MSLALDGEGGGGGGIIRVTTAWGSKILLGVWFGDIDGLLMSSLGSMILVREVMVLDVFL